MYRQSLVLILAGASALLALEPKRTELHSSYQMQPGAALTVTNINGSIEISGWDQSTVDITATKYAETAELLDQVKVDVATDSSGVHIRTVAPESGNVGVKYVIKVPRSAQLAEIRSTNGALRINEVDGPANLHTTNGAVRVAKMRGKLDIQTTNGAIDMQEVEGEVLAHTTNGAVHASVVHGSLTATTSNGGVHADLEDSRGGPINLTTTNGGVDLKLGTVSQSAVKAITTNGGITVRMPASAGARIKAETSERNQVHSDFEVHQEGTNSPSHLEGTVGSGGQTLELTTSQGGIRLLKL
jgi:DUF4097 and DUF4098 domain-containing protein YvlB